VPGARYLIAGWIGTAALILGSCTSNAPVAKLQQAKPCSLIVIHGYAGFANYDATHWTFNMGNDGGWCWGLAGGVGGVSYAPSFVINSAPAHGAIAMEPVSSTETRIAYQPAPGFVGTDGFILIDPLATLQINATITVRQ
jgi:hypothetical protein